MKIVRVVLDATRDASTMNFVEIEDADGKSVNVPMYAKDKRYYVYLRTEPTPEQIHNMTMTIKSRLLRASSSVHLPADSIIEDAVAFALAEAVTDPAVKF